MYFFKLYITEELASPLNLINISGLINDYFNNELK